MSLQDEAVLQYVRPLATFLGVLLALLLARQSVLKWLYSHSRGDESVGHGNLFAFGMFFALSAGMAKSTDGVHPLRSRHNDCSVYRLSQRRPSATGE